MASSDDTVEGSISSILIDSLKSNQRGDALSPEEIAWVDSFLVKDPEISDGDWSSMKDALIEILGLKPEPSNFSAPGTDGFPGGTDIEMLHSAEPGTINNSERTDDDSTQTNKEMETSSDDEDNSISLSTISLRNAFLPNYREEDKQRVIESVDSGLDIGSSTYETDPTTQDIFKVWDLGIPSEEDELVKQLNKAFSESNIQPIPSPSDDSGAWKDLKVESVDDLIAGIADLSLNQHSN